MGSIGPVVIASANGSLVADIGKGPYLEGTHIFGRSLGGSAGSPMQPNQSWFVTSDPLGSIHYLIVSEPSNLCVGVGANAVPQPNPNHAKMDDATDRGAVLTLQVQATANNEYQLWDFLPVTGGSGSTAFIQNPATGYVIELQSHDTSPCPLVVNPRRISNDDFQLWTAIGQGGSDMALPLTPMAQDQGHLQGHHNFVFLAPNQGDHLIGLTVTLDVIEDIQVESFSLQVNCNTPYSGPSVPYDGNAPGAVVYEVNIEEYDADTEDFDREAQWLQFGLFMRENQLVLFNQIWHRLGPLAPSEFPSKTSTSLPFLRLQDDTIPAGTRIILNLCTDHTDFAIGMTGLALDVTGRPIEPPVYFPVLGQPDWHTNVDGGVVLQKAMAPIAACQVVFCSLPGAEPAQFTSGMGTLTVTAAPGMTPERRSVNPFGIGTAEDSNMPYDLIPSVSTRLIAQPFGVKPAPIHLPRVSPGEGQTAVIIEELGGLLEVLPGDAPGPPTVINDDPLSPEHDKNR
jgi:hypothetical protein